MTIIIDSMRADYRMILELIMQTGDDVAPRGQKTREILGETIVLTEPGDALPIGIGRGVSQGVAAFEALQLIGAFSDPILLNKISPSFSKFMNDGKFWGAYGHRIQGQLQAVVRKLKQDTDSRQAVITLWNPMLDNVPGMNDYPCTVSLHFMIRHGKLVLHTHMRSNDAWLGLAYDAFQFTQLQMTVAHILGINPGTYYHHTSSLHIYEEHWDRVESISDAPTMPPLPACGIDGFASASYGTVGAEFYISRAQSIAVKGDITGDPPMTPSERWYAETIAKYR